MRCRAPARPSHEARTSIYQRGKSPRRTMSRKIPTTIKDPELVAQRRREIIDVATHLLLERGFHKTSIRDIARACPFNLASLYMYVTSKEDILFLVAQQLIDEKARAMAAVAILENDPAESFRTALRSYCRIVHQYRPHIRLLYRELDEIGRASGRELFSPCADSGRRA